MLMPATSMTTQPAKRRGAVLSRKERIDRALRGAVVDRQPFSFWQHFRLAAAEAHAEATLDFHRRYRTDLVKVMSEFPYPKPAGKWYDLKPEANPFPQQIRALELIRDGLQGKAYFIETVFNPWRVAQKLSSNAEVRKLKEEMPQLDLAPGAPFGRAREGKIGIVKRPLGGEHQDSGGRHVIGEEESETFNAYRCLATPSRTVEE